MPGPLSSNVSRRPARPPLRSDCSRATPPPPWSIVLRASSLAAVTIFVWSTRLKPISTARMRTTWRTTTMSVEERTGSVSSSGIANTVAAARERRAKKLHALVDVQARPNARQGQAQLHQRDGNRGSHADHDRLGVEHAGHRRDVADHAADEGIDDLERRDVDEHAAGAIANDAIGEVVLQRHGQAVVHVDLDADEQELVHLEDRNALHALALTPSRRA